MEIDLDRIYSALVSIYHRFEYHDAESCPATVYDALAAELSHIDTDSWKERHSCGGIYLNGRHCDLTSVLTTPCRIEYYEPKGGPQAIYDRIFDYEVSDHVLYEDEHLLSVWKPAGIHCLPAKEQQVFYLQDLLQQYCKGKIHMPSRLDYSTAGVILVSKHPDAHAPLQQAFENRTVSKYYLLASHNEPQWTEHTTICNIGRDKRHHILRCPVESGGKLSETHFRKLCSAPCVLLARPKTGRTHQIRVHAAYGGFPIIGDNFYNGSHANSLHLCSVRIDCKHPITEEPIRIAAQKSRLPGWAQDIDLA